jgi:hypothetical protein
LRYLNRVQSSRRLERECQRNVELVWLTGRLYSRRRQYNMALIKDLLDKPPTLSTASKYTMMNGVVYLGAGALLLAWPGATQTLFLEPAFVGNEEGLIRMIGMTVAVIGWLYLFGGRSGSRQFVAASVVDRLVFVPAVLVPLAIAGAFPHLLVTFAILDPSLAIGAWSLFGRNT